MENEGATIEAIIECLERITSVNETYADGTEGLSLYRRAARVRDYLIAVG